MAKAARREPDRLISIEEGMTMLGQSRANFYRLEKSVPGFPRRVYPNGPGSKSKLLLSEVEAYIARRLKERDGPQPPKRRIGRPVAPPDPPPAKEVAHEGTGQDPSTSISDPFVETEHQ